MPPPSSPAPERFRNQQFGKELSNQTRQPTFRRDTQDPVATRKRSRGMSPSILLLLVVGVVVAMFGAGKLPQINTWSDDAGRWVHDNNDSLVSSIVKSGPMLLMIGGGVLVVLIFFLWRNAARRKQSS